MQASRGLIKNVERVTRVALGELTRQLDPLCFSPRQRGRGLAKAKELRSYAEPLITLAKNDSVANRRLAFDRTRSKAAVGKLFEELGPRYQERPGGYIRILKCGFRTGDKAPMAFVELVDRPQPEIEDEEVVEASAED